MGGGKEYSQSSENDPAHDDPVQQEESQAPEVLHLPVGDTPLGDHDEDEDQHTTMTPEEDPPSDLRFATLLSSIAEREHRLLSPQPKKVQQLVDEDDPADAAAGPGGGSSPAVL